jgi:hypothetical protein
MVVLTASHLGLAGLLAIMLFVLLGYEYRIPVLFTIVLVPLIVGMGLGVALAVHVGTGIGMTASLAIIYGFVLIGIIAFEKATS